MTSAATAQNTVSSSPDFTKSTGRATVGKTKPGQSQSGEEGLLVGSFTYVMESTVTKLAQAQVSGDTGNSAADPQALAQQLKQEAATAGAKLSDTAGATAAEMVLKDAGGETVKSAATPAGTALDGAAQAWLGIQKSVEPGAKSAMDAVDMKNPAQNVEGDETKQKPVVTAKPEGIAGSVSEAIDELSESAGVEDEGEAVSEEASLDDFLASTQSARTTGAYVQAGQDMKIELQRSDLRSETARPMSGEAKLESQIAGQVGRHLHTNLKSDMQPGTMKLSLTPPHLGRVEITFVREGDSLHMTFRVESAEAMNALRNASSDLSQLVISKGGEWREVTIRVSQDGDDGKQRQQSQDQRQQRDSQRQPQDSWDEWQEGESS